MSEQEPTLDEFINENNTSIDKYMGKESNKELYQCVFSDFPDDWCVDSANNLMEITRGASPRPRSDDSLFGGDIPWIKIGDANLDEGDSINKCSSYVTEKGKEKSKFVESGTLLVANSGATCGFAIFAGVDGCVHDGWLILRDYDGFNSKYLYHYINKNYEYLQSLSLGSAQTNLNTSLFGRLDISKPPISEQRKISTVLSTVDQVIKKINKIINHLQRVKKGYLQQNIINRIGKTHSPTELGELPDGWEKVSVESASKNEKDSLVDGPFGSSLKSGEFVDEGYARVIQLKNVREAKYVDDNLQFVTEEKYKQLERHSASPGDVYIAKMASPVARACILPDKYEHYMMGCADVVKLEPSEEFVDEFIMYCLNSYPVWKQAAAHIRGSGRLRINLNQLKEVDLPKPPINEQQRIVNGLNTIASSVEIHQQQKENIQRLKQGLMQDLLSGKVRTTDKNITVPDEVAQHG